MSGKNNKVAGPLEPARYIKEKFGIEPDYPWDGSPEAFVFRHPENRKWFALQMTAAYEKFGVNTPGSVHILNLKADPLILSLFNGKYGVYPAYHMNRNHWISVLLDGGVEDEVLHDLIDDSFLRTAGKRAAAALAARPVSRLVPANPKYYDLTRDFRTGGEYLWKQSCAVNVGDTVYIYVAAPYSAVMYKCEATGTDIIPERPYEELNIRRLMRLKVLESYPKDLFDRRFLESHGVYYVRGPRYMPDSAVKEIEKFGDGR